MKCVIKSYIVDLLLKLRVRNGHSVQLYKMLISSSRNADNSAGTVICLIYTLNQVLTGLLGQGCGVKMPGLVVMNAVMIIYIYIYILAVLN